MKGFGNSVGVEEEGTVSRGSDNVINGRAEQYQAVLVLSISGGKKGGGSVGGQQSTTGRCAQDVAQKWVHIGRTVRPNSSGSFGGVS